MISFREVSDVMDMVFFSLFNSSSNIFAIILYINNVIMGGSHKFKDLAIFEENTI